MPTEAIRRIIHVFSAEGENRVVQAHNKVASATETTGKATLSLDKQFSGLERRYNTMVRAQQDYERVQRQVNAAVAQNPALQERANTVLGLAAQKYNTLVAANDNFAAAQKRASAAVAGFAASVQGLALGGAIGALAGLAGGLLSGREFITNTIEADNALQRLRAVLDATGNAAGITEKEVLDLSAGIQQTTRYGDEAVTTVTALLLSLSDIGKDTVPRAVRAITDMATVLDVDLNSAAVTLSKALEGNVTALQRYGVTINKDVIDSLKAAGRETEAYDLVLSRLEDRFGGAAVKARQSLGGALDALKNAFGDLFELGSQGQPLIESIERLTQLLGQDDIKNGVLAIGKAFVDAFTQAITLTQSLVGAMNDLANFNFSGLADRVRGLFDFNVSLTGGGLLGAITGGSKGTVLGSSPGLPQGFPGVTGDLPQPFNTEFMNSIKEVNDRMLEYGVIAGKARKITDAVAESAGKAGKKFQDKAKSVDVVIEALQKLSNTAADFISSFVQGIIDGKNAVESLGQSLKNAGSSLLSSGLKDFLSGEGGLLKGLTGAGGLLGSLTGSLSSVLGIGAGAATGGITALLGAGVGLIGNFFGGGKKQSEQQALQAAKDLADAQQKWRDMASDFSSWIHDWTTGVSGELHNAIESARSQMQSFANAASAAHDPGGVASAQAAFNTGVTRSINEALDALLNLGVETSSYSQKLKEARDKAEDIRLTLIEFGTSAEDAALAVETRLNVAIERLRDQFLDDLVRKVNELAGGAWINQLTDLVDEVAQLRTDAAALGIQTGLIDEYFVRAAQKIIDENQLVGSAFDAVAATLGPLGAGLHEFSAAAEEAAQALKRSAQEIANTIQSYQDQLFIAQQDAGTLSGALAIFDLQAQRAVEQEIAAGGEALAALQALQEQQRLNIIIDFNQRALEEQQRLQDEQNRLQEQQRRELEQTIEKQKQYVASLQSLKASLFLGANSTLSPRDQLAYAQSQFASVTRSAAAGDENARGQIQSATNAYLEAARAYYGSSDAYASIFTSVQNTLDSLIASGANSVSTAERQLSQMQTQTSLLSSINDNISAMSNGVYGAASTPTSAAGIDLSWMSSLPGFPAYANGTDFHRGGMAIVGERGPEIVNLPRGSRVTPTNDNGDAMTIIANKLERILAVLSAGERMNAEESARTTEAVRTLSRQISTSGLSRARAS